MDNSVKPVEPGDLFSFDSRIEIVYYLVTGRKDDYGSWHILRLDNLYRSWDREQVMLSSPRWRRIE